MTTLQRRFSDPMKRLLNDLCAFYSKFPSVLAVVIGGSQTTGSFDSASDLDVYVYTEVALPLSDRLEFIRARALSAEIDARFWETTDEWEDLESKTRVDLMYRSPDWIRQELHRSVTEHNASIGYSTCLWHNVLTGQAIFERDSWYSDLKSSCRVEYPVELRNNIVAKNYPLLRQSLSSFLGQMLKAHRRSDWVSVNHRGSAFLASYFDVLFAINGVPHPGEKRLVDLAGELTHRPARLDVLITDMLHAQLAGVDELRFRIGELIDALDACMASAEVPIPSLEN